MRRAGLLVLSLLAAGVAQAQVIFESGFECVATPGPVAISDQDAFPVSTSTLPVSPEYRPVPFYGDEQRLRFK